MKENEVFWTWLLLHCCIIRKQIELCFIIKDLLTRRDLVSKCCISLTDIFMQYKILVNPDQEYLIQEYLEGEPLLQNESGSASFGAKVVPSLNGVDLCLWTQLLDPTCRKKCSNILHDSLINFLIKLRA
jgi:hypothetical protein